MRATRIFNVLLISIVLALSAGCAVRVIESNRVANLAVQAKSIVFIWTLSQKTKFFSFFPGAAYFPIEKSKENLKSEHQIFGELLKKRISANALVKNGSVDILDSSESTIDLPALIKNYASDAAIVVIEPESTIIYCAPGCYAFTVRVKYYEPGTGKLIFSALLEIPPKTYHQDPFDPVVEKFEKSLVDGLAAQKLLP